MTSVTVDIHTESGFRATEILADLRNVAEVLFYPMMCVGFWDGPSGGHICPQLQRGEECSHSNVPGPEPLAAYRLTVEDQLRGSIEVVFPHADVNIFLR